MIPPPEEVKRVNKNDIRRKKWATKAQKAKDKEEEEKKAAEEAAAAAAEAALEGERPTTPGGTPIPIAKPAEVEEDFSKFAMAEEDDEGVDDPSVPAKPPQTLRVRTIASFFQSLFPVEFRETHWRQTLWDWMQLHHPWMCLCLPYKKERDLRIANWILVYGKVQTFLLANTVVTIVFNADDGTCEMIKRADLCNRAQAPAGARQSICKWNPDIQFCIFQPAPIDYVNILVSVLIIALISSPVYALLEFLTHQTSLFFKDYIEQLHKKMMQGKELLQLGEEVDGHREFWQQQGADEMKSVINFQARIALAARLRRIQEYIDYVLPDVETELLISVTQDDLRRFARQDLVTKRSFKPLLSSSDTVKHNRYKFFSRSKAHLLQKVKHARLEADKLRKILDDLPSPLKKEEYLMRRFITDCFKGFRREIVSRYLLDPYYESRDQVATGKWVRAVSVIALPIVLIVEAYAIFALNVGLGSRSAAMWLLLAFLCLIEEVCLLQTARIWLRSVAVTSLVGEELRRIFSALQRRFTHIVRRRGGVISDSNALLQHFSPACRAARLYPHLPVSRFLLALNDYDVPIFDTHYESVQDEGIVLASIFTVTSSIGLAFALCPPRVQDLILDMLGSAGVNLSLIAFCFVGTLSAIASVLVGLAMASYLFYREYKAKKARDNPEATKEARRLARMNEQTKRIRAQNAKLAKSLSMAKANASLAEAASAALNSTVVFESKFKPVSKSFKPYNTKGVVSPNAKGSRAIVPFYGKDESEIPVSPIRSSPPQPTAPRGFDGLFSAPPPTSSPHGDGSPQLYLGAPQSLESSMQGTVDAAASATLRTSPHVRQLPPLKRPAPHIGPPPGAPRFNPPQPMRPAPPGASSIVRQQRAIKVRAAGPPGPGSALAAEASAYMPQASYVTTASVNTQQGQDDNKSVSGATYSADQVHATLAHMEAMLAKNLEKMRLEVEETAARARRRAARRRRRRSDDEPEDDDEGMDALDDERDVATPLNDERPEAEGGGTTSNAHGDTSLRASSSRRRRRGLKSRGGADDGEEGDEPTNSRRPRSRAGTAGPGSARTTSPSPTSKQGLTMDAPKDLDILTIYERNQAEKREKERRKALGLDQDILYEDATGLNKMKLPPSKDPASKVTQRKPIIIPSYPEWH